MRILALDVGEKRIGVAASDPTGTLASPVTVLQRTGLKRDLEEVLRLAREYEAERILVGMPISLDGVAREQARLVQGFCDQLAALTAIPVATWDERFSTVEAERRMREAGRSPEKRRQTRDAVAAAVLLQSYLESLGRSQSG